LNIIIRNQYLEILKKFKDTEFIKVITGVRRSGKTFVIKMFHDFLLNQGIDKKQIIYISFESLQMHELLNKKKLYTYIDSHRIANKKMYLFFDEIQRVEGFEDVINSFLIDFPSDIYVTGSNASLLSGELATYLAGRYIEIPVFPLSFKEYLNFKQSKKNVELQFYDYVSEGGFPAVVLSKDDKQVKRLITQGIFDSIVLRDISMRAQVKNDALLLRLTEYLLDIVGNPISANKILGSFQNEGMKLKNSQSIIKYMSLLESAFIFYKVQRYDLRGKERLSTLGKYYAVDTGLRNVVLQKDFHDNLGYQIENIVYIELLRRGYAINVGKYNDFEIDFVARYGKEIVYYQVTQQLPINSNREIENLRYLPDNYKKIVLTANRMDVGKTAGIEIIHVIDWLLDNDFDYN
jgi:predicted AAA+ superfamily ATPase